MTRASSRRFPGQSYAIKAEIASGENPVRCFPSALIGTLEEVLRQHGQLVAALAQGIQPEDQGRQGEIELGPNLLALERGLGIGGRGRQQPDRRIERPRPAALEGREGASGFRGSTGSSRPPATSRGLPAPPAEEVAPPRARRTSRRRTIRAPGFRPATTRSRTGSRAAGGPARSDEWLGRPAAFPYPASPTMSTGVVDAAARRTWSSSRRCDGPNPIKLSNPDCF